MIEMTAQGVEFMQGFFFLLGVIVGYVLRSLIIFLTEEC
jgi:hypothetical protein